MFKSKYTAIIGLIVLVVVVYFVGYRYGTLDRDPPVAASADGGHGEHSHEANIPDPVVFNEKQQEVVQILTGYASAMSQQSVDMMESYTVAEESFIVIEYGSANFGWQDYRVNHIIPELAMLDAIEIELDVIRVDLTESRATATFFYKMNMSIEGNEMKNSGFGTAILKQTAEGWRIGHFQI